MTSPTLSVDEHPGRTCATAFRRLVQSNFAAQFSEQIALAAAPLAAVLAFGATAAQTGALQTAQTLPFCFLRCRPACWRTVMRAAR